MIDFVSRRRSTDKNTHKNSSRPLVLHRVLALSIATSVFVLVLLRSLPLASAMRIVVQRVKTASVANVDEGGKIVSSIGPGLLALVGLHEHDTVENDLRSCCSKLLACKLWENDNGGMWRHSVKQRNLEVLLVSQFTLYGTLSKKNQPDYKRAMKSQRAQRMYGEFVDMVRQSYSDHPDRVKDGVFGAMMDVSLVNDGPGENGYYWVFSSLTVALFAGLNLREDCRRVIGYQDLTILHFIFFFLFLFSPNKQSHHRHRERSATAIAAGGGGGFGGGGGASGEQ